MTDTQPPITDPRIQAAFDAFPDDLRRPLLRIRAMIFDLAGPDIGPVCETLKWGQPAYLPKAPRTGTAIRLHAPRTGGYAVLVHCQTTLIRDLQNVYGGQLAYDGTRAVVFDAQTPPPEAALSMLIRGALTYHKR